MLNCKKMYNDSIKLLKKLLNHSATKILLPQDIICIILMLKRKTTPPFHPEFKANMNGVECLSELSLVNT